MYGRTSSSSVDLTLLALQGTYREGLRVKRDTENCVFMYDSLQAEVGLVNVDGVKRSLMCIRGTIPISFDNEVYNFPIEIVVPEAYPFKAPLFRVTPTGRLRIKAQHRHVDEMGVVYHPYLSSWNAAQSNLAELVVQVALEFGKDPPLYEAAEVPPPISQRLPPPPPVPASYSNGRSSGLPPPVYQNAVPPPVYKQKTPPPPPISSVPKPPVSNGHSLEPLRPIPKPPVLQPSSAVLKTRLSDKIKFRCATTFPKLQKDIQTELENAEKLEKSGVEIETRMKHLKKIEADLQQQLDDVNMQKVTLESWLEEKSNQAEEIKARLDDFVVPSDAMSKQIFSCVADSLAIDDMLYQLNNSLIRQRIDLKTFLKQARALSREQFLKQALAMKIYSLQTTSELNAPSDVLLRAKPAGRGTASGQYNGTPHYPSMGNLSYQ